MANNNFKNGDFCNKFLLIKSIARRRLTMKKTIILFFIILFVSCSKSKPENNILSDEIIKNNHSAIAQNNTLKVRKDSLKKSNEKSPIIITSAKLFKNQYSDHKDIKIAFKNTGKKSIKAIKFEWFCSNSFEEPANGRYFYGEGRFKERYVKLIKPGETKTEYWEDFSTDANKINKIRAYYIVYTDGTKWGFYDDNYSL